MKQKKLKRKIIIASLALIGRVKLIHSFVFYEKKGTCSDIDKMEECLDQSYYKLINLLTKYKNEKTRE